MSYFHKARIAEQDVRGTIPGWVEPPGSSGYRESQRRQLQRVALWLVFMLAVALLFAWPYIRYAIEGGDQVAVALHEPRP